MLLHTLLPATLLLVVVVVDAYPIAFPGAFPELDDTVSQAMDRGGNAADFPAQNGFEADFPVETSPQVTQTDPRYAGPPRSAYPYPTAQSYANFGAGAPIAIHAGGDARDVLIDDRPFPGDSPATLDTGAALVHLGPGERLVPDDPNVIDEEDMEPIPLAGPMEVALSRAPRALVPLHRHQWR